MQLTRHQSVESFLGETLAYLEQDEAVNNLMLGIALRLQEDPSLVPQVELITIHKDEALALAGLMTVPANLILYHVGTVDEQVLQCLAAGLMEGGTPVPGVVGSKELVAKFAQIWPAQAGCSVRAGMKMRIYELRQVNLDVVGPGRLRPAGEGDLSFLSEAIAAFQRDAGLDEDPDPAQCLEQARRLAARGYVYLWELGDQVVSMAAKSRPTRNGCTINLVYTPQELRGRGYATSCVASLSQLLLESGYRFCTLITDLANPTSNSIYQKIGYRPLADFDEYYFE